ncbi:MAG: hypothetical protein ACE5MI_04060 [Acidimicrobiia bacterium]
MTPLLGFRFWRAERDTGRIVLPPRLYYIGSGIEQTLGARVFGEMAITQCRSTAAATGGQSSEALRMTILGQHLGSARTKNELTLFDRTRRGTYRHPPTERSLDDLASPYAVRRIA